jgi:hypothetical protein
MANNEVDKIRELTAKKDEEEGKVANRRAEKIQKEAQVVQLKQEIKVLEAQS